MVCQTDVGYLDVGGVLWSVLWCGLGTSPSSMVVDVYALSVSVVWPLRLSVRSTVVLLVSYYMWCGPSGCWCMVVGGTGGSIVGGVWFVVGGVVLAGCCRW